MLTNLAFSTAAVRVDPVVRDQLLRTMRSTQAADSSDEELLDRALLLGVPRVDPLVRERLAFQGEQVLRARLPAAQPDQAALTDYLRQHADRYRVPAVASFVQVFLSRTRRGDELAADAQVLAKRFVAEAPEVDIARRWSDPSMLPGSLRDASEREIDARFGPGFGARVLASVRGSWSSPIESAYGVHFIYVQNLTAERLPELSEIRARVTSDYRYDHSQQALRRELLALRDGYRIQVKRGYP